jgi:hypothetical protein
MIVQTMEYVIITLVNAPALMIMKEKTVLIRSVLITVRNMAYVLKKECANVTMIMWEMTVQLKSAHITAPIMVFVLKVAANVSQVLLESIVNLNNA